MMDDAPPEPSKDPSEDPQPLFSSIHPVPISNAPGSELVWRSLRETWLVNRVLRGRADMEGGFAWDPGSYGPVMVADPKGAVALIFARDERGVA